MLHIPCDADRSSFASLVAILQSTGNASFVRVLSAQGIKSARDLENASRSRVRELSGDVAMEWTAFFSLSQFALRFAVTSPRSTLMPEVRCRGSVWHQDQTTIGW